MNVKKGDNVVIISGKYRGDQGRILRILRESQKVIVEGQNMVYRHTKPSSTTGQGGIIEKEAPIHASNVMLYSPKAEGPVRTQKRWAGKGGVIYGSQKEARASFDTPPKRLKKVRYCVKTGETFE